MWAWLDILIGCNLTLLCNVVLQGKPVTDVCDTDVMDKCLQTKGLDTYGIGKVRQCLLHAGASDIAAADEARLEAESQVIQSFSS